MWQAFNFYEWSEYNGTREERRGLEIFAMRPRTVSKEDRQAENSHEDCQHRANARVLICNTLLMKVTGLENVCGESFIKLRLLWESVG